MSELEKAIGVRYRKELTEEEKRKETQEAIDNALKDTMLVIPIVAAATARTANELAARRAMEARREEEERKAEEEARRRREEKAIEEGRFQADADSTYERKMLEIEQERLRIEKLRLAREQVMRDAPLKARADKQFGWGLWSEEYEGGPSF